MKKFLRVLICVIPMLALVACTFGNGNKPSAFDGYDISNVQPDPVKPSDGVDSGNADITDDGNTDDGKITQNNEPKELPLGYTIIVEGTRNAGNIYHIYAFDSKADTLWQYDSEEVLIGQYDSFINIGERDNGYYFVLEYTLYCLDRATGEILWQTPSEYSMGSSCSYDFDDDGNIYLCGYEGPSLAVVDINGNVIHYYSPLTNADEIGDDYYWRYDLWLENGEVYEKFESKPTVLIIDPETGIGREEEFDEKVDFTKCVNEWEMCRWESDDGSDSTNCEDTFKVIIDDYYTMSVIWTDSSGNEHAFENMQIIYRNRDLYDGVRDDFYGIFSGECQYDEDNSFAFQLTEPDTLELIWFQEHPQNYIIITFMDKELLDYYKDKGY